VGERGEEKWEKGGRNRGKERVRDRREEGVGGGEGGARKRR